jgi:hypothetical protein
MRRPELVLALALAAFALPALASAEGRIVKYNRDELRIFDEAGNPLGVIKASTLPKTPAVVKQGKGGSLGIQQGGRLIFLRPLDVNTQGVGAECKTVQVAARGSGQAIAAQTMGVGSAKDCRPQQAAAK